MSEAARKLEQVRRVARDIGVPMDTAGHLAISVPRAARLLDMSVPTFKKFLAEEGVAVLQLGRNLRIDVIDLVDLMERNKIILGAGGRVPGDRLEMAEEIRAFGHKR
jgi:hypothetical protein